MTKQIRLVLLIFLTPIIVALLYSAYIMDSRQTMIDKLIDSGVIALYDGGMVSRDDIKNYFLYPPVVDGSLIGALELTPEDLIDFGSSIRDFELLQKPVGQMLLFQVIKHIVLIKHFNQLQGGTLIVPDDDPMFKTYLETLIIEAMEQELSKFTVAISQQEIMAYYLEHPDLFLREGKRMLRHLTLSDEEKKPETDDPPALTPNDIWKRLQNGENFQRLIEEVNPEVSNMTDNVNWIPRGSYQRHFDDLVWSLTIGDVTGPIHIEQSYHFIQVLDEQPEGLIPLEECSSQIQTIIEEEKRAINRNKFLGLPDESLTNSTTLNCETYPTKVLQSAYAREWDKNIGVVNKIDAYKRFLTAERLCKKQIDHYKKIHMQSQDEETSWLLESEAVKDILSQIKFKLLIHLELPTSNQSINDQEETEHPSTEPPVPQIQQIDLLNDKTSLNMINE